MSDNAKISIMAIIENIAYIVCFTALAIAFHHWWIALFSILFINTGIHYVKEEKKDEK